VDGKGRLALPKTFRRIVGVKKSGGPEPILVFTQGLNGCIGVYTEDEWPTYERRLRDKPFGDQDTRDFALELARVTMDVPVDTVGRVLIPQIHMDLGGLEKNGEVLVLGMFDHIELWNPGRYEKRLSRPQGTFDDRARGFYDRVEGPRSAE
jgi:MraZ protein